MEWDIESAHTQQMVKEAKSNCRIEWITDRKQSCCQETHFLCLSSSFNFILLHKSISLSWTQSLEFTTRNSLRFLEKIPVQRRLEKFGGLLSVSAAALPQPRQPLDSPDIINLGEQRNTDPHQTTPISRYLPHIFH